MVHILTGRFKDALGFAFDLHATQIRKGSGVAYIAHLLSVAGLVIEDGGDEDESIAALLHDAVEDQGGPETLEMIRERYGERVAEIVEGCSDSQGLPKPPWRGRKEAYIAHLRQATPSVRKVSLADKIHNARDILMSHQICGEVVWTRFRGGKEGTLWYYRTLVEVFRDNRDDALVAELDRVVTELERLGG